MNEVQVREYVASAQAAIDALKNENTGLQQKVASLTGKLAGLEDSHNKQAAIEVDPAQVIPTVDLLVKAGMPKKSSRDASIEAITTDPVNCMLSFMSKLASQRIAVEGVRPMGKTASGSAAPSTSSGVKESDAYYEQAFN